MEQLKKNCSNIIDRCNKWLEKCRTQNRSEQWIDCNFPAMFLHLCKGNDELHFLKHRDGDLLRNRGLSYRIQDYRLLSIEFTSPWNCDDYVKRVDEINNIFKLSLPVTFNLNAIPKKSFQGKRTTSVRGRFLSHHQRIQLATEKQQQDIKSLGYSVQYQMNRLQNFSFK